MNATPTLSQFAQRGMPRVHVLLLDFSPAQTALLWHAAAEMLPAIEIRLSCRSSDQLAAVAISRLGYDVVLVGGDDSRRWVLSLQQPRLRALTESSIIIGGNAEEFSSIQTALLHAGFADVICAQSDNAKMLVHTVTREYLRRLRRKNVEMPSTLLAHIQRLID